MNALLFGLLIFNTAHAHFYDEYEKKMEEIRDCQRIHDVRSKENQECSQRHDRYVQDYNEQLERDSLAENRPPPQQVEFKFNYNPSTKRETDLNLARKSYVECEYATCLMYLDMDQSKDRGSPKSEQLKKFCQQGIDLIKRTRELKEKDPTFRAPASSCDN